MTQKREIKFRGFRIDKNGKGKVFVNGEWVKGYWVEGYYFENANGAFIIQYPYHANYIGVDVLVKIIPETVGQYTGLTDKDGKKIFEGDILRFTRGGNEHIGKVVYEQRICGLDLWYNEVVGAYGEKATFRISLTEPTKLEVIGNIYDNPELLEVE